MAITLVQSAKVGSGSSLTPGIMSIAFPSPVTAGNMLIATVYDSAGNASLANDTQSNVYTQALLVASLETPAICVAYAIAASSGANTVSFDFGLSAQGCIIIAEYSGMGATPTVDQQNQNIPAPASTVTTGAITTTSASELILAVALEQIGFPPATATWAIDSSFTVQQQSDNVVAGDREMSFAYADLVVAATGTFDPTFTVTSSQPQTFIEAGIVSFIPSGAPPPPVVTGILRNNPQVAPTRAGIKTRLITIPPMESFDDVRKVISKSLSDLQTHISTQLPVTNQQGKRLGNVGSPVAADDVVTLRYLQSNSQPSSPPPSGVNQGGGGGGSSVSGAGSGAGSGSVTSVALTVPAEFAVAGSPITGAGTFAITKATEAANTVWAGPASGGAVAPTFRALVKADISPIGVGTGAAFGSTSALSLAATIYVPISGGPSSTTETNVNSPAPIAGTFSNFYVNLSVAPGLGKSVTFNVRKNGSSTGVTATVTGIATSAQDTTDTFTCVAGDLLAIQVVPSAALGVTPNVMTSILYRL